MASPDLGFDIIEPEVKADQQDAGFDIIEPEQAQPTPSESFRKPIVPFVKSIAANSGYSSMIT